MPLKANPAFSLSAAKKFKCPEGKPKDYLMFNEPLGIGIEARDSGVKSWIFRRKVRGTKKVFFRSLDSFENLTYEDAKKRCPSLNILLNSNPLIVTSGSTTMSLVCGMVKEAQCAITPELIESFVDLIPTLSSNY